jgi:hypothetical protein
MGFKPAQRARGRDKGALATLGVQMVDGGSFKGRVMGEAL